MYVKSGLAGSNFFFRTYNGFSNRRLRRIRPKLPDYTMRDPDFGHTREQASKIRGALMARVVRVEILHCLQRADAAIAELAGKRRSGR